MSPPGAAIGEEHFYAITCEHHCACCALPDIPHPKFITHSTLPSAKSYPLTVFSSLGIIGAIMIFIADSAAGHRANECSAERSCYNCSGTGHQAQDVSLSPMLPLTLLHMPSPFPVAHASGVARLLWLQNLPYHVVMKDNTDSIVPRAPQGQGLLQLWPGRPPFPRVPHRRCRRCRWLRWCQRWR